jgi:hypothetical protein
MEKIEISNKVDIVNDPLPLKRSWKFWIHTFCYDGNYVNSRKCLHKTDIDNIKSFWQHYNNIPSPGYIFTKQKSKQTNKEKIDILASVEGLSFFVASCLPDWEDKNNENGCTLIFKGNFNTTQINEIWCESILCLIGEYIVQSNYINGVRSINRLHNHKLEIWINCCDSFIIKNIKEWFISNIFQPKNIQITTLCNLHILKNDPSIVKNNKPNKLNKTFNPHKNKKIKTTKQNFHNKKIFAYQQQQ